MQLIVREALNTAIAEDLSDLQQTDEHNLPPASGGEREVPQTEPQDDSPITCNDFISIAIPLPDTRAFWYPEPAELKATGPSLIKPPPTLTFS